MTSFTGLPQVDPLLADAPETINRHGNRVRHVFLAADRYLFDFRLDLEQWAQLDTESDAWYFGVWVDKAERRVLSYVEGDVYLTQCADDESYDREIAALCAFHGPSPSFVTIDDEKVTAYYQERAGFFIDPKRATQEPSQ